MPASETAFSDGLASSFGATGLGQGEAVRIDEIFVRGFNGESEQVVLDELTQAVDDSFIAFELIEPVTPPIYVDGYEAGDVNAWSTPVTLTVGR